MSDGLRHLKLIAVTVENSQHIMFHWQIMATRWEICNCIYYVIIPLDALSRVISLLIKLWQGKKPILWMRSWQEKNEISPSCPYYMAPEGLIRPGAEGIVLGYQSWVTAHLGPGSILFNINSKTSLCATESRSRPKFTEIKAKMC